MVETGEETLNALAPKIAAHAFADAINDKEGKLIDFGCGTGLVGVQLQALGFKYIDGVDVSESMLQQAKQQNIYQSLMQADLTATLPIADNAYDGGLCVGTIEIMGSMGAEHFAEMLRVLKPEALMVVLMNEEFFRANQFDAKFARHESAGRWQILKNRTINDMQTAGRLMVGQKSAY